MNTYHVLLADDDANITKGLSDILRGYFPGQFTLHCADSGPELKNLLCSIPAALVITDIKMPGMTGLDCLQFIRDQGLQCEVVLLSGYNDYTLLRQALKLQVLDYMLKPVHIASLVRLIHELLPRLEGRIFAPAKEESPRQVCAQSTMSYFDIPVSKALDERALSEVLEAMVNGVQNMDDKEVETALMSFFAGNDGSVWDETATKNALIRCIYQLMERVPAMIHIIAESKLTRYDAVNSIKNLPTLSQLRNRLLEIVCYDIEQLRKEMDKHEQYLVAKAKDYITTHYMQSPTLEEVAGELHITPGYFSTLFRQLSGVTFREYLRNERIAQAQRLISEGGCKLYEVAEKVGYQSTSHFNRAFKDVTGITPSIWALHHQNKR